MPPQSQNPGARFRRNQFGELRFPARDNGVAVPAVLERYARDGSSFLLERVAGTCTAAYEGGAITLDVLKDRKAKLADKRVRIQKLAEAQEKASLAPEPSALSNVAGRIASGTDALG